MRPIATYVARSVVCMSVSVCLSVCQFVYLFVLGTRMSCAKAVEQIKMPFGGDSCEPKKHIIVRSRSPRKRTLLRRHVPAHCVVPTHECILHCSPTGAGECACRAHASSLRGVTRRRCGLLPNYFAHLFYHGSMMSTNLATVSVSAQVVSYRYVVSYRIVCDSGGRRSQH